MRIDRLLDKIATAFRFSFEIGVLFSEVLVEMVGNNNNNDERDRLLELEQAINDKYHSDKNYAGQLLGSNTREYNEIKKNEAKRLHQRYNRKGTTLLDFNSIIKEEQARKALEKNVGQQMMVGITKRYKSSTTGGSRKRRTHKRTLRKHKRRTHRR